MDKFFDILGALVGVALVTTVVAHPQSSNVIKSFGSAFSSNILAAQGQA
jgi:hypothetical protein